MYKNFKKKNNNNKIDYVFKFGKYKGVFLKDMNCERELNYLNWIIQQDFFNNEKNKYYIDLIKEHILLRENI